MLFNLEHLTSRENVDGTVRYYFRRRGQPLTRIHGEPMSHHFMNQYRACLRWVAPDDANSEETVGTNSTTIARRTALVCRHIAGTCSPGGLK